MLNTTAPILRAFADGKRKQDARKMNETPEERLKREKFKQISAEKELKWLESAKKQKVKQDEKIARRIARKRRESNSIEIVSWNNINFDEPQEVHTPQMQGELCLRDSGIGISVPELTDSTVEKPPPPKAKRPKKHKTVSDEVKKSMLSHYCYLKRNKRKAPIQNTLIFGQQLKPPVFVSDSTFFSWIHNPKNGVNTSTWKLDENVAFTSEKKAGRPSILDEETLASLQDAIIKIRIEIGARISIPMTQSIIKRLLKDLNKENLVGDGPGRLQVSRSWTRTFLVERMNWSYKAVTSCTKYLPKDWQEQGKNFVLQMALLIRHHNLTEVDVYNIDETNMLYNPAGKSKTWDYKGKIEGTDDYYPCQAYDHDSKQMITVVCAITASGERLPLQYIFAGKQYKEKQNPTSKEMERRLDEYGNPIPQFGSCPLECKPIDACFVQTSNHWANADTTLTFFEEIIIKHADKRPDPSKPIIVIWDNAKFHCTEEFRGKLRSKYGNKIILSYLPTNTTSKLQPLDVSVNGAFKQAAKNRFMELAAEKCLEQLKEGNTAYHDLHKNVSKVSSAQLVEITQRAWDRMKESTVISGWKKSGMMGIFDKEVQSEAFQLSSRGELVIKCLNTRTGKGSEIERNHRMVLDVFSDEDHLLHEWEDTSCDDDSSAGEEIDEETIAGILLRIRTTSRTRPAGRPASDTD